MKFTVHKSSEVEKTITVVAIYDYSEGNYTHEAWEIQNFNSRSLDYKLAELILLHELKGKFLGYDGQYLITKLLEIASKYIKEVDESFWEYVALNFPWSYSECGPAPTLHEIKLYGSEGRYNFSYTEEDVSNAIKYILEN